MQIEATLNLVQEFSSNSSPAAPKPTTKEFEKQLDQKMGREAPPPPDRAAPPGSPPKETRTGGEATSNEPNAQEKSLDSTPETENTDAPTQVALPNPFVVPVVVAAPLLPVVAMTAVTAPVAPTTASITAVAIPTEVVAAVQAPAQLPATPVVAPVAPETAETAIPVPANEQAKPSTPQATVQINADRVAVDTKLATSEVLEALRPTTLTVAPALSEAPRVNQSVTNFETQVVREFLPATPQQSTPQAPAVVANIQPLAAAAVNAEPSVEPNVTQARVTSGRLEVEPVAPQAPRDDSEIQIPTAAVPKRVTPETPVAAVVQSSQTLSNFTETQDLPEVTDGEAESPVTSISTPVKPEPQVSAPPASNVKSNVDLTKQVMDKLDGLLAARKNGTVTIHLEPRELGQIIVTVKSFGSRMEADISASNDSLRQQLDAGRALLHQQLESKGVTLTNLNVDSGASSTQSQNQQAQQESATRRDFEQAINLRSPESSEAPQPQARVIDRSRSVDLVM